MSGWALAPDDFVDAVTAVLKQRVRESGAQHPADVMVTLMGAAEAIDAFVVDE